MYSILDMKYDAYYDAKTYQWQNRKCNDSTCTFCSRRPDTAEHLKAQSEPESIEHAPEQ